MKRIALFFAIVCLAVIACGRPPGASPTSPEPPHRLGFVPQPNGILPAPGSPGNVLTSGGGIWISSAPPGGGGSQLFSVAIMGQNSGAVWNGGNYTAGRRFVVLGTTVTCNGVRFWAAWTGGANHNIKATLQNSAGTVLGQTTASIASGTLATITWAPVALSQGTTHAVTLYETSGTYYPFVPSAIPMDPQTGSAGISVADAIPWYSKGDAAVFLSSSHFHAGDSVLAASGGYNVLSSEFYVVEPTFL